MNHIVVGPYDGHFFVAYQVSGTNVYQPVGETMSELLAIAECDKLNQEAKSSERRKKRGSMRRFDDWVAECKAADKKPVPPDDPVFKYAAEVGLSLEFVRLAWMEFSRSYTGPRGKTYIDWNQHFQNAVRRNFYKLWFYDRDGKWQLTTAGRQLELELKAKQDHNERQHA